MATYMMIPLWMGALGHPDQSSPAPVPLWSPSAQSPPSCPVFAVTLWILWDLMMPSSGMHTRVYKDQRLGTVPTFRPAILLSPSKFLPWESLVECLFGRLAESVRHRQDLHVNRNDGDACGLVGPDALHGHLALQGHKPSLRSAPAAKHLPAPGPRTSSGCAWTPLACPRCPGAPMIAARERLLN